MNQSEQNLKRIEILDKQLEEILSEKKRLLEPLLKQEENVREELTVLRLTEENRAAGKIPNE